MSDDEQGGDYWYPDRGSQAEKVLGTIGKNGRRTGRPTKLTKAVGDLLLEGFKQGLTVILASKYSGIHRDTFYGWLENARADPDSFYALFSDMLDKSEADLAYRHLMQINMGVERWQASAWMLERKHAEDYGLKKDQAAPTTFVYNGPQVPQDEELPPDALEEEE